MKLTDKQARLLTLAAEGLTNAEIATYLGLKERTVKNMLTILYKQVGAKNCPHCVAIGMKRRWIKPVL